MKEVKLLDELEKVEKLTIKGVYSPGEAVKTKMEIIWKKLGQYFAEDNLDLKNEIKVEFKNFKEEWINSYHKGED